MAKGRALDKSPARRTFVATSYPRSADDAAGHFVRAEVLDAVRSGARVTVVAPGPVEDAGVRARPVGGTGLFAWPGAAARLREAPLRIGHAPPFLARARAQLVASEPDEIVAHWLVPSFFPIAAGVEARMTVVCHGADVRLLRALPSPLRRGIVDATLRSGARVRFVAGALRDALFESLPARTADALAAVSVVRPPSVEVLGVERRPGDVPYAVVAARLVRDKRVDVAVRAARAASLGLVVIGDGPEEARLRRLGHGTFQGRLGRRETLSWIASARVMLHPSAVDAAPTSVLEARALGVPVVSFGAGDVAAWAERDAAIRVVRSEGEMAELLRATVSA